jgi:hypothetical protein
MVTQPRVCIGLSSLRDFTCLQSSCYWTADASIVPHPSRVKTNEIQIKATSILDNWKKKQKSTIDSYTSRNRKCRWLTCGSAFHLSLVLAHLSVRARLHTSLHRPVAQSHNTRATKYVRCKQQGTRVFSFAHLFLFPGLPQRDARMVRAAPASVTTPSTDAKRNGAPPAYASATRSTAHYKPSCLCRDWTSQSKASFEKHDRARLMRSQSAKVA